MSNKDLASARSFWKRKELLAGRRSRYVEVQEVSLDSVAADAVENGPVDEVVAVLGAGKEANVYLGLWKGSPLALKVYRLHSTPHRKKAKIGYAPDMMGAMAAREFTTLDKAYRAGVPVPTPARRADNMFTMRFLGEGQKAPLLKEAVIDEPELRKRILLGKIPIRLSHVCARIYRRSLTFVPRGFSSTSREKGMQRPPAFSTFTSARGENLKAAMVNFSFGRPDPSTLPGTATTSPSFTCLET